MQAVDDMNGKELNGRQVYVGRAQKKGERQNELKRKFEQMKQDRMTRYQVCQKAPSGCVFIIGNCHGIKMKVCQMLADIAAIQTFLFHRSVRTFCQEVTKVMAALT